MKTGLYVRFVLGDEINEGLAKVKRESECSLCVRRVLKRVRP
jgi:hypothetical protein